MAYRFKTYHVCNMAKTAIQQAKESIMENPNIILRPSSRDAHQARENHGHAQKERGKFSNEGSICRIQQKNSIANVYNKQTKNNTLSYCSSCHSYHYPDGNNGGILREHSKMVLKTKNILKFPSNRAEFELHDSLPPAEVNTETEMQHINKTPLESEKKCFRLCYSDVLKESMRLAGEEQHRLCRIKDSMDKFKDELKMPPTKAYEPKLLGSQFNITPSIGPPVSRGHFVRLRSTSAVMHSEEKSPRISIRKSKNKKKRLPKLFSERCSNINIAKPPLKYIPLKPPEKVNHPQEPLKCAAIRKEEPCKRADDDWKLEAKPFGVFSCVPKPTVAFQMKPSEPLRRLAKVKMVESKRICEDIIEPCVPRSDIHLTVSKKTLPLIPTGKISSIVEMLTTPPLRRLKKIVIPDPIKVCPVEADEKKECVTYDVPKKVLPPLVPLKVPSLEPLVPRNSPSLKRLGTFRISEPPKICNFPKQECQPRADENLQTKKKKLQKITFDKFKVTSRKLNSSCPLRPPKKINYPKEPPKICPKPICESTCRLDSHNFLLSKRSLPKIPAMKKTKTPSSFKEGKHLKRLQKVIVIEPPKICPIEVSEKTERADAHQIFKKRSLPKIKSGYTRPPTPKCPQIPPLRRLTKIFVEEPKRMCPVEPTEKCQRSIPIPDKRKLPLLESPGKVVKKQHEMKNSPSLKRLIPRPIEEKLKECVEAKVLPKECYRSDCTDWSFPVENSFRNTAKQIDSKSVCGRRSMSTNLTNQYTDGLLTRKMQLSYIDVRKRLSLTSEKNIDEDSFRNVSEYAFRKNRQPKSTDRKMFNFSDDASMKDLQPKYSHHKKFEAIEPIKPEASELNPEIEDECIRKKCNIPKETYTGTCDDPNPKPNYLRVSKTKSEHCSSNQNENCGNVTNTCSSSAQRINDCDDVVKVCSSAGCDEVTNSCSSAEKLEDCDEVLKSCSSSAEKIKDCDSMVNSCSSRAKQSKCKSPPLRTCPPSQPPPSICPPVKCPTSCTPCPSPCQLRKPPRKFKNICQKPSLWQRVKNYFKARPNCPTPAEAKKKKMLKKIRKMADKAGLAVYDPCDDPSRICKEVKRRCCLARKCSSSCTTKRNYFCFSSHRNFHSMSLRLYSEDSCSYQGQQVNGEFTIPGFCLLYRCIPGQGVTAIGCGISIPPDGCYVEHPKTKNYPECCYTRVVCPEANSVNEEQSSEKLDQFNGTFIDQNLGYPKVSYRPTPPAITSTSISSISKQQGFSTIRPQVLKALTPPFPGSPTVFRPTQKKRPSHVGFSDFHNTHNQQWEDNLSSGPYYYRK